MFSTNAKMLLHIEMQFESMGKSGEINVIYHQQASELKMLKIIVWIRTLLGLYFNCDLL